MARVTVEDCLEQVENRFALVLIAAQRTRQIIKGSATLLDVQRENKEAVIALREIAEGLIPYEIEEAPSEEELQAAIDELRHAPEPAPEKPLLTDQLFSSLDRLQPTDFAAPSAPAPAGGGAAKEEEK